MTLPEVIGLILGYFLGIFTAAISFIRQSRTFHPRGVLYEARVEGQGFYQYAIVRLSSAIWKDAEWKDVLGIAIRFTSNSPLNIHPMPDDQDLLFATIKYPWQTPIGPWLTDHTDFLLNKYYAVSPFCNSSGEKIKYRLVPVKAPVIEGSRQHKLTEAVLLSNAIFVLQELRYQKNKSWEDIAEIKLIRSLHFDQETLRFHPFRCGLGIRPIGLIHHMRIGAYNLSQKTRPKKAKDSPMDRFEV